jgi:hypothetical protein
MENINISDGARQGFLFNTRYEDGFIKILQKCVNPMPNLHEIHPFICIENKRLTHVLT